MTKNWMWPIGLFERLDLVGAQFDIDCFEDLFQMMCFGGPYNRRGHAWSL